MTVWAHLSALGESVLPVLECGDRKVALLGIFYRAELRAPDDFRMTFLRNVGAGRILSSLEESGIPQQDVAEIKSVLPKEIQKGTVLIWSKAGSESRLVISPNGQPAPAKALGPAVFEGVIKAVKSKIGKGWKAPCPVSSSSSH